MNTLLRKDKTVNDDYMELFERFVTPSATTYPDIDLNFSAPVRNAYRRLLGMTENNASGSREPVPAAVIRAWAHKNGHTIGSRGRVSRTISDAYHDYMLRQILPEPLHTRPRHLEVDSWVVAAETPINSDLGFGDRQNDKMLAPRSGLGYEVVDFFSPEASQNYFTSEVERRL